MVGKCLSLILFILSYGDIVQGVMNKKDWEYTVQTAEVENDHPAFFDAHLKHTRISRGVYGCSGNATINSKLLDAETKAGVEFYRSARNDNQYQSLPFNLPEMNLFEFMNKDYKKFIMDSMKECSDFPVFDGPFDGQLFKKGTTFTFTNCLIKDDASLPNHLQPGFYKVIFFLKREPEISMRAVIHAEVKSKVG